MSRASVRYTGTWATSAADAATIAAVTPASAAAAAPPNTARQPPARSRDATVHSGQSTAGIEISRQDRYRELSIG